MITLTVFTCRCLRAPARTSAFQLFVSNTLFCWTMFWSKLFLTRFDVIYQGCQLKYLPALGCFEYQTRATVIDVVCCNLHPTSHHHLFALTGIQHLQWRHFLSAPSQIKNVFTVRPINGSSGLEVDRRNPLALSQPTSQVVVAVSLERCIATMGVTCIDSPCSFLFN